MVSAEKERQDQQEGREEILIDCGTTLTIDLPSVSCRHRQWSYIRGSLLRPCACGRPVLARVLARPQALPVRRNVDQ
jgi:hypothetical protein